MERWVRGRVECIYAKICKRASKLQTDTFFAFFPCFFVWPFNLNQIVIKVYKILALSNSSKANLKKLVKILQSTKLDQLIFYSIDGVFYFNVVYKQFSKNKRVLFSYIHYWTV